MHFLTGIDPVTLTFDISTPKPYHLGYPKVILYTNFKHFGIFRF